MIIIVTGSIATGKSTATAFLRSKGYPIVDTDLIARQVVEPQSEGLVQIVSAFGEAVLDSDGTLNRAQLGEIIFNNADKREQLNQILHPLIYREAEKQIHDYQRRHHPLIFVDIPLFFEVGTPLSYDAVWLIYTRPEIQLQRLIERNHLTESEAKARITSQIPIDVKKEKADCVFDNSDSIKSLYQQLEDALQNITQD